MGVNGNEQLYLNIHKCPLFQGVSDPLFQQLMDECELKFYEKGEPMLYSKTQGEGLLLILTGMAEVFVEGSSGKKSVLEVLQKGELLGFSNLAYMFKELEDEEELYDEGYQYTITVEAVDATHCLKIPHAVIKKRLESETVRNFLLKQITIKFRDIYTSLAAQVRLAHDWGESEAFIRRVQDLMRQPVLTVKASETVQNVAKMMVEHKVTSVVVVDEQEHLVGIITEQDLVKRVLVRDAKDVKGANDTLTAKSIMTPNPYTISRHAYHYEALSVFYMNGVKHLPVIDESGRAVGIITMSDLIAKKNHSTMEIIKTIEQSSYQDLAKVKTAIYGVLSSLIKDDISATNTLEVITTFYDRLASRCVQLAVENLAAQGFGTPPVEFAWYLMGSGGRGEQFMLTDQDHFLVYDDLDKTDNWDKQKYSFDEQSENIEEDEVYQIEEYFTLLGKQIVELLEGVGYKRCKGLMMSSEANWRGSIQTWQERLRTWALKATDDDILLGHNFLSFRFVVGSSNVNEKFVTMAKKQLKVSKTFMYLMAQQEREHLVPQLEQPLIAFFGQRQSTIDIKKHALFPFQRCLQILGVHNDIIEGTPLDILAELEKKGQFTSSFADELRHAFEVALSTRITLSWNKHLRGEESSTEIKLTELNSWKREELIIALKSIRALQFHLLKKL